MIHVGEKRDNYFALYALETLQNVIKLRTDSRLDTYASIADRAKLNPSQISLLMSGKREKPTLETIVQLAVALELSLDWLVTRIGKADKRWPEEMHDILKDIEREKAEIAARRDEETRQRRKEREAVVKKMGEAVAAKMLEIIDDVVGKEEAEVQPRLPEHSDRRTKK